jgi:dTMP kinase
MSGGDTREQRIDTWHPVTFTSPPHGLPGRLVVLEGVDGSGKTTLINRLLDHVPSLGMTGTFVRVPSDGIRQHPFWRAWADESLGVPPEHIDGYGLSVMALGDRLCQQAAQILPALAQGEVVLCDRYILSSLVYECSPVHEHLLSRLVAPDLGVLVDASVPTVMARLGQRDYERVHSRDEYEKPLLIERYRMLADLHGYHRVSTDGVAPDESFDALVALMDEAGIWTALEPATPEPASG